LEDVGMAEDMSFYFFWRISLYLIIWRKKTDARKHGKVTKPRL
jgi:hypothetical protein